MKFYAVTPIHVSATELARRQARYDALCPPGLKVELHDIGDHAPRALDTADEVRVSETCVVEALRQAPPGYDALVPDCVLDPGVAELSQVLTLPVLGLLRISVGWSICTGRMTGAVARNKPIADEIQERVDAYGFAGSFTGVDVLDLDVEAIADTATWAQALDLAGERFRRTGTSTLINGCSAVELPAGRGHAGVRIVDPTALALRLVSAGEAA